MQKQKADNFHTGSHSLLMKTSRALGTSTETVFQWSIDTVLPPNTWKSPIAANPPSPTWPGLTRSDVPPGVTRHRLLTPEPPSKTRWGRQAPLVLNSAHTHLWQPCTEIHVSGSVRISFSLLFLHKQGSGKLQSCSDYVRDGDTRWQSGRHHRRGLVQVAPTSNTAAVELPVSIYNKNNTSAPAVAAKGETSLQSLEFKKLLYVLSHSERCPESWGWHGGAPWGNTERRKAWWV